MAVFFSNLIIYAERIYAKLVVLCKVKNKFTYFIEKKQREKRKLKIKRFENIKIME